MSQLALPLIAPPLSQKRSILDILPGADFSAGRGWHSNKHAVRFGNLQPRFPKETHFRCYAYTTAYGMMIPLCNHCS